MYDSKIKNVMIEKINLEKECFIDLSQGKGIRISSPVAYTKKNEKIENGLQSEFFGSTFSDDLAFTERYACKCKKYIGKIYEGLICENCQTPVEYNDTDITKTGWIILDNFHVISPIFCAKLMDALGTYEGNKVLYRILETKYLDKEYDKIAETSELKPKELEELKKHPFVNKGMRWLKENIIEVLEYYEKKKPGKVKLINELKNDVSIMFTSCIPVYTALLRTELPGVKGNKLFKMKINTTYQSIIRSINFINKITEDYFDELTLNTIDIQLAAIQMDIMEIFNTTYSELTSKKGILLSKVMGGRYNFSARSIIVPSSGILRADEVELGYITFMELYRYEIINLYSKIQNCTIMEASNIWKKGLVHFNQTLYNIMSHMVNDSECKKYLKVLISRNPCIEYGSFLLMNIVRVKEDINDKTMTIPSNVLRTMNADFDGDVENIFRIFGEDFAKRFGKTLNPRYNLYISRMTGTINTDTLPIRDEVIGFWGFNCL